MAAECLHGLHKLEVFCPQIRFQRKTVRGKVWFQEAMFPGYFFARFDLWENKRIVCHSPGVMNIPVFNDRIFPVPETVIEAIRDGLGDDEVVDACRPLSVGEETTVLAGPMCGLKVKVIRLMPAQERVAVLMEMLGTLVEAVFPEDALEHQMEHPLAVTER